MAPNLRVNHYAVFSVSSDDGFQTQFHPMKNWVRLISSSLIRWIGVSVTGILTIKTYDRFVLACTRVKER